MNVHLNPDALADITFSGPHCWRAAPRVSTHARQRFRERTNLMEWEIQPFVNEAYRRGRGTDSYEGFWREYLLRKEASGCQAITHNGLLLLFSLDETIPTLITVYPLPDWFGADYVPAEPTAEALTRKEGLFRRARRFWHQLFTGKELT